MPKLTISYRRADSESITGRIFDRLVQTYGKESVFRDVDNIPLGIDFRQHIDEALKGSDVLIVVIGRKWTGRNGRIKEEADPVRIEVEAAIRRGLRVVPVLVEGAQMPKPEILPESLKDFSFLNAATIDSGKDFDGHMQRLIRDLDRLLESPSSIGTAGKPHASKSEDPRITLTESAAATVAPPTKLVSSRYLQFVFAFIILSAIARYAIPYIAKEYFYSGPKVSDFPPSILVPPKTSGPLNSLVGPDKRSRAAAYEAQGETAIRNNLYQLAVIQFGNAIEIDPTYENYSNRCYAGMVYGMDLEKALADCTESLRLQPGQLSTLDYRGFVKLKLRRFNDAIADFNAVLKLDSEVSSSLYGRGKARLAMNDAIGGLSDQLAARKIQPDIADDMAKLGIK